MKNLDIIAMQLCNTFLITKWLPFIHNHKLACIPLSIAVFSYLFSWQQLIIEVSAIDVLFYSFLSMIFLVFGLLFLNV